MTVSDPRVAYSVSEVAEALGISIRSVRQRIKSGELPARRVGARVLILASDLRIYLASLPPVGEEKSSAA